MALPNRTKMSVEEYLQLDRDSYETRYEYIDGQITMLAGGTTNHSTIQANLIQAIGNALGDDGPCNVLTSDSRVRLSEQRYVYPDVSVICDDRDRGLTDSVQFPRVVVEVLSPSTERYDRGRKLTYYRACPSIQEYLLVHTQEVWVELHRREKQNLWTYWIFEQQDVIELASLNIRIPVAALYKHTIFPDRQST